MACELPREVLGEFAFAVATKRVEEFQRSHGKRPRQGVDLKDARLFPPRLLRGIVLFQNCYRRRKYRREFGDGDDDANEPPSPQIALALYMCRRLRNPAWVNITRESLGLGGILYAKQRLSLTMISEVLASYVAALGPTDAGVQLMAEKKHLVTIQIQEEAEDAIKAIAAGAADWGHQVRAIIDRTREEWCIPLQEDALSELEEKLTDFFTAELEDLKDRLAKCPTTPAIIALHAEAETRLIEDYFRDFEASVQRAKRQRREFLIYELETRWEYPLEGCLGPLLVAQEQYNSELPDDCTQKERFIQELKELKWRLEKEATEAFNLGKKRMDDLKKARENAPQVKTVLKEFDGFLDEALADAQAMVPEWGEKIGVVHSLVRDNALALLTPRSFQQMYVKAGDSYTQQLRDPASSLGTLSAATTNLKSVVSILGALSPQRWLEEFGHICADPISQPTETVDLSDLIALAEEGNGTMPSGFELVEGIPTGGTSGYFHTQNIQSHEREIPSIDYASTLDLLVTFEHTPPTMTTLEIEGDETATLPSNRSKADSSTRLSTKKNDFFEPRPGTGSGRVLAQLTLFDKSMEDVYKLSEEVLAAKLVKAIAEAGGIDPSRLRILGFRPGSVKIFFEIDSEVIFEVLREVQDQLRIPESTLRNDVEFLSSDAEFLSIPRNAFVPSPSTTLSLRTTPFVSPLGTVESFFEKEKHEGRDTGTDEWSRVMYRTNSDETVENPHGHHSSYTFYTAPSMAPKERKWNPFAKFNVTRYPVRAPVNYSGYQSWCSLSKTMGEWLPEGKDTVQREFAMRRAEFDATELDEDQVSRRGMRLAGESDHEEEELVEGELRTARVMRGQRSDQSAKTARMYPWNGREGIQRLPLDNESAAIMIQAIARGYVVRRDLAAEKQIEIDLEEVAELEAEWEAEVAAEIANLIALDEAKEVELELAEEEKFELEAEIEAEMEAEVKMQKKVAAKKKNRRPSVSKESPKHDKSPKNLKKKKAETSSQEKGSVEKGSDDAAEPDSVEKGSDDAAEPDSEEQILEEKKEIVHAEFAMVSPGSSPKKKKKRKPLPPVSKDTRPPGDLTHADGVRSWVGMLSGIQGTGLRGPVTQADEFIKFRDAQKQSDEVMASFASPVFIRQQYRNMMAGLGPPYHTKPKKLEAWTWHPLPFSQTKLEEHDWVRTNPVNEKRRTKLGPTSSVREPREVSPPKMVGSPGQALLRSRALPSSSSKEEKKMIIRESDPTAEVAPSLTILIKEKDAKARIAAKEAEKAEKEAEKEEKKAASPKQKMKGKKGKPGKTPLDVVEEEEEEKTASPKKGKGKGKRSRSASLTPGDETAKETKEGKGKTEEAEVTSSIPVPEVDSSEVVPEVLPAPEVDSSEVVPEVLPALEVGSPEVFPVPGVLPAPEVSISVGRELDDERVVRDKTSPSTRSVHSSSSGMITARALLRSIENDLDLNYGLTPTDETIEDEGKTEVLPDFEERPSRDRSSPSTRSVHSSSSGMITAREIVRSIENNLDCGLDTRLDLSSVQQEESCAIESVRSLGGSMDWPLLGVRSDDTAADVTVELLRFVDLI